MPFVSATSLIGDLSLKHSNVDDDVDNDDDDDRDDVVLTTIPSKIDIKRKALTSLQMLDMLLRSGY